MVLVVGRYNRCGQEDGGLRIGRFGNKRSCVLKLKYIVLCILLSVGTRYLNIVTLYEYRCMYACLLKA